VTISSAQLSAGYNCFTNYSGAFWAQKKEILGLMCDMMDVLRSDASTDAHPVDNRLFEKYESYASARWPTNNSGVDSYIALMSDREAELQAQDVLIHAAAQQTNHAFSITLLPSPPLLSIGSIENGTVISWTNAGYLLQSASDIEGPFNTIPGASSPYTNTLVGPLEFFRLITNH
jgi:hypothetical protein